MTVTAERHIEYNESTKDVELNELPQETGLAFTDSDRVEGASIVSLEPGVSSEIIGGLPSRLLDRYVALACKHAIVREVDPGVWVARIVGFQGAWADADNAEDALAVLPAAVAGWVVAKREAGASDIPVLYGLDLNPRESE